MTRERHAEPAPHRAAKEPSTSPEPAATMQIGEVAARTELSLRSLRHWEEVGLLRPNGRSDGGFRLYTEDDVEKILVIRRMKPLGFSLDQMRDAMADIETLRRRDTGDSGHEQAINRLRAIQDEAQQRRVALVRQLQMADEFLDMLQTEVSLDT